MKKDIIAPFNGFTPQTIRFFEDIEQNNYKEWFEAHRSVYENELLKPFKSLVTALTPVMYNIDQRFELNPSRIISRIYRDIRFSKNKDPYKTCMWMTFQQRVDNWENYPGFFMELSATGYNYGMGLYMAKRKFMDNFREKIEYDPEDFRVNTQRDIFDRGFMILGDYYARTLPNDLPEYFQQWYQRKSVCTWKKCPVDDVLFSPKLVDKLSEDFQAMEWLYNFLKDE